MNINSQANIPVFQNSVAQENQLVELLCLIDAPLNTQSLEFYKQIAFVRKSTQSNYLFPKQLRLLHSAPLQFCLRAELATFKSYFKLSSASKELEHYQGSWQDILIQAERIQGLEKDKPVEYQEKLNLFQLLYQEKKSQIENLEEFSLFDPWVKKGIESSLSKSELLLDGGYNPLKSSVRGTCEILGAHNTFLSLHWTEELTKAGFDFDWMTLFSSEKSCPQYLLQNHPLSWLLDCEIIEPNSEISVGWLKFASFFAKHTSVLNRRGIVEIVYKSHYRDGKSNANAQKNIDFFVSLQEKHLLSEATPPISPMSKDKNKIRKI